uniref:Uncharacterized protein n=1 Tax=Vitis vinifera TaxID=29760 RepID=A5ARP6_VITVI|nr:hypothetical protein VITISV_019876 [Vitis vinifera]
MLMVRDSMLAEERSTRAGDDLLRKTKIDEGGALLAHCSCSHSTLTPHPYLSTPFLPVYMSPKPTIFNPFITLVRYPALHPHLHPHLIANVGSGGGGAPVSATAPAAGGASTAAAAPVVEEKKEHMGTPGRGCASAAVLWQLFQHGGIAAAAEGGWRRCHARGGAGASCEEDEVWAWV